MIEHQNKYPGTLSIFILTKPIYTILLYLQLCQCFTLSL